MSDELPSKQETRWRGRSVPSPQPRTDRPARQAILIERHIFSVKMGGTGEKIFVCLAPSAMTLDKLVFRRISPKDREFGIALSATDMNGGVFQKMIMNSSSPKLFVVEGWKNLTYSIEEGEILEVSAPSELVGILSLEFIKDGRAANRGLPVPEERPEDAPGTPT